VSTDVAVTAQRSTRRPKVQPAQTVLDRVIYEAMVRFEPPPRLKVSDWADAHRVLSPESSASPGMWRTSTTPYLREIMDAFGDSHTEVIAFMKSAQVGATEALINAMLYVMANDPGPSMYIMPTLEMAGAISKDRVQPAIRDCDVLRDQVGAAKMKGSENTILRKSIAGAVTTFGGANSPAGLASRPVRVIFADEVDRFPASAGAEGDPLALAIKRTTAFRRRKILIASTPTVKGASRIEDWWEISDKRLYHTPCPRCSEFFVAEWEHVRWDDGDVSSVRLECPACGDRIEDSERAKMIGAGEWRATAPFSGVRGYRVWEIVAPWRRLTEIVNSFLVAKRSTESLRVWVNTCRGELWEEPGERIEAAALLQRRERYASEVPRGAVLLTAGVDTQDNRLEAIVVGWGEGEESWIVARETLLGDPTRADVWFELDAMLGRLWAREGGGHQAIECALVDAGFATQAVYSAVIPRQRRQLFASFGRSGGERGLLVSPPKPIKTAAGSVFRRIIDVDQAKALVYGRLRVNQPGPEHIHFPLTVGESFFSELTAEQLVTRRNRFGVPEKKWEQVKERNESLDCYVMALAAYRIKVPTPNRLEAYAARLMAGGATTGPAQVAPPPAQPKKPWIPPKRGWLK
jgi:phage terminase large subunit GpA-like protein